MTPIVPLHRLAGRTFGLLGFGNIARATGRKGRALGLDVIAHDPYISASVFGDEGVRAVDFRTCLSEADMVSIHLPLTNETRVMVSRGSLAVMKRGGVLVGESRGAVVDGAGLVAGVGCGGS